MKEMRLPCDRCGKRRVPNLAVNSYRINDDNDADLGNDSEEKYVELCRECMKAFRKFMVVK